MELNGVIGVVHAKGKSTRIPNKNSQKLLSDPMYMWALRKLRHVGLQSVVLDSDNEEFLDRANKEGFNTHARKLEFATNATNGHELLLNLDIDEKPSAFLQLSSTAPFLSVETLKVMLFIFKNRERGSFTVSRRSAYQWKKVGNRLQAEYDVLGLPNSFELEPQWEEITAAYLVPYSELLESKCRISRNAIAVPVNSIEALDVNTQEDLLVVRALADAQPKLLRTGYNNETRGALLNIEPW